jgi:hypothetical protein
MPRPPSPCPSGVVFPDERRAVDTGVERSVRRRKGQPFDARYPVNHQIAAALESYAKCPDVVLWPRQRRDSGSLRDRANICGRLTLNCCHGLDQPGGFSTVSLPSIHAPPMKAFLIIWEFLCGQPSSYPRQQRVSPEEILRFPGSYWRGRYLDMIRHRHPEQQRPVLMFGGS